MKTTLRGDQSRTRTTVLTPVMAMLMALFISACASVPDEQVTAAMGRAEASIEAAEAQDADQNVPVLYREAKGKYRAAEIAFADGRETDAVQFAEKAEADAKLAVQQSALQRSQSLLAEIEAGIDALEDELNEVQ